MRFSVATLLVLTAVLALVFAVSTERTFAFQIVQAMAWIAFSAQIVEVSLGYRVWSVTFLQALNAACMLYLGAMLSEFSVGAMILGCLVGFLLGRRNVTVRNRRTSE